MTHLRQFIAVDHGQHGWQVHVQHGHRHGNQAVDDAVTYAVVRQDLAGLETHFALIEIQLELADA